MAEGWARHLLGDRVNAYSAGIETHGLNPNAVAVMAEAGVDISSHTSKTLDDLRDIPLDLVIKMMWMMIKTGRIMLRRRIDDRND